MATLSPSQVKTGKSSLEQISYVYGNQVWALSFKIQIMFQEFRVLEFNKLVLVQCNL